MASRLVRIAVLVIGLAALAYAGQVPEYELKAELLSRFPSFIEWPSSAESRTFTIGIVGRSPFNGYLEPIATRRIKGRPASIRYITDLSQIDGCDVVFICASEQPRLPAILAHTGARPILTVGDTNGFAAAGVLINFYTSGDTVHFEINETAVERSGLRVSSKLFKLARIVETEGKP